MHQPREVHWTTALRILAHVKSFSGNGVIYNQLAHVCISGYSCYAGDKGDKKLTTRYCIIVVGNLVIWRSWKQDVLSRSSTEAEYKVMTHTACKMMWLKNLIMELDFRQPGPMSMRCDNQSAIYIAQNPVFHERTKHIKVDYHLDRDAWIKKVVSLPFTPLLEAIDRSSYPSGFTTGVF